MARNNVRFWLIPLALAVSGMLAFAATWASADRIERSLHPHVRAALDDAGMRSADVTMDGRDAVISDVPEGRSERVEAVVGGIEGVRGVDVREKQMTDAQRRAQSSIDRVLERAPIRFAAYSTELKGASNRAIAQLADVMRSTPPELRFRIGGHAAQVPELNQRQARELSRGRAEAVATALVEAGVNHRRLTTIAHADTQPAGGDRSNGSAAEDRRDRRVEITVL
ncbi:outer membrane protein/peptidoglycan-associated (lipo)protein [Prauserella sp. Am3]|nr:outer membrane protein/peptidoglycan-associated (lipo)protein [Prauserella sp. Am3]